MKKMKKFEMIEKIKETEKAINVTIKYNDSNITIWLPKSSAKIVENCVEIKENFWRYKEMEVIRDIRTKGNVRIYSKYQEYDKSIGIKVHIYECLSEQSISRMMFFPKSQIVEMNENSFVVPAWLFAKKEQEIKEENATSVFKANTFEVEIEKEYIN